MSWERFVGRGRAACALHAALYASLAAERGQGRSRGEVVYQEREALLSGVVDRHDAEERLPFTCAEMSARRGRGRGGGRPFRIRLSIRSDPSVQRACACAKRVQDVSAVFDMQVDGGLDDKLIAMIVVCGMTRDEGWVVGSKLCVGRGAATEPSMLFVLGMLAATAALRLL